MRTPYDLLGVFQSVTTWGLVGCSEDVKHPLRWYRIKTLNPYPDNGGGVWNNPQCSFCRKSSIFCETVTDPLCFPTQLSCDPRLPILRGRFGSNVHVTGFATTVRQWSKDMNFMWYFWMLEMLEPENSMMTRQEYKQRYLYIFKMTDKTGSSNRSTSKAHRVTDSCSRMNLN